MHDKPFTIRPMRRGEIDFALGLAAAEGWNSGLHDAEPFSRADPGGFLIGQLGERPIGCISAVSYGGAFGFVGFYIVVPEMRGQGYGLQLWQTAMKRLEGQTIGLDGVLEQQANYRKSGFMPAYSNIREHTGVLSQASAAGLADVREVPFDTVNLLPFIDRHTMISHKQRSVLLQRTVPGSNQSLLLPEAFT